jgi:hypothetical protein
MDVWSWRRGGCRLETVFHLIPLFLMSRFANPTSHGHIIGGVTPLRFPTLSAWGIPFCGWVLTTERTLSSVKGPDSNFTLGFDDRFCELRWGRCRFCGGLRRSWLYSSQSLSLQVFDLLFQPPSWTSPSCRSHIAGREVFEQDDLRLWRDPASCKRWCITLRWRVQCYRSPRWPVR